MSHFPRCLLFLRKKPQLRQPSSRNRTTPPRRHVTLNAHSSRGLMTPVLSGQTSPKPLITLKSRERIVGSLAISTRSKSASGPCTSLKTPSAIETSSCPSWCPLRKRPMLTVVLRARARATRSPALKPWTDGARLFLSRRPPSLPLLNRPRRR